MTASEQADEELHEQSVAGDSEAQDELRSRLLGSLYDFALRISIDPGIADAATHAAADRLVSSERRSEMSFYAWSMATVRDETLERVRSRGSAGDSRPPLSPVDPIFSSLDEARFAEADTELAGWVWQAARSQRPRDYSLLDLSIRRGLSADEIADATDMSHSGIYAILGRLRGLFEETFASTLLYHRGREACAELEGLVAQHTTLGPALRREIARHVEGCPACRQTRRSFPSPADLLAGFLAVSQPALRAAEEDATGKGADEAKVQAVLPLGAVASAAYAAGSTANGDEPAASLEEPASTAVEPAGVAAGSAGDMEASESTSDGEAQAEAEEFEFPLARSSDLTLAMDSQPDEGSPDANGSEAAESESAEPGELPERGAEAVGAGRRVPVAAAAAAGGSRITDERLHFERDRLLMGVGSGGSGKPPRRPWDRIKGWLEDQGPARVSLTVLFAGALLLAVYLGLALGDSIEGGSDGSSGGLAALPTTTPGVRQIACGSGTYTIDQGNAYTLAFDSAALPGFQISKVGILPVSDGALAQAVEAKATPPLTVEVQALRTAATRTDEYRLQVTFSKLGERDVIAECKVLVRAPAVTATAQPSPAPAASPTRTPSPRPAATQAPAPTQPAPTETPIPVTPSPTYNPTIPTFTPTSPPTSTATATLTPTPQ